MSLHVHVYWQIAHTKIRACLHNITQVEAIHTYPGGRDHVRTKSHAQPTSQREEGVCTAPASLRNAIIEIPMGVNKIAHWDSIQPTEHK